MTGEIVVLVTCAAGEAETLANTLVEDRLVACVNMVPNITSVYRWKGEVCKDSETLLIIKSTSTLFETLEQRIRELHSYDVPEIISIQIHQGHKPYLDWLNCQLGQHLPQ